MKYIVKKLLFFLIMCQIFVLFSCKENTKNDGENSKLYDAEHGNIVVKKIDLEKVKKYLNYPIVDFGFYKEYTSDYNLYNKKALEWLVLEHNEKGVLLLSREVLAATNQYGFTEFGEYFFTNKGEYDISVDDIHISYMKDAHWVIGNDDSIGGRCFFNLTKEDISKYFGEMDVKGINMKAAAKIHDRPRGEGVSFGTKNNEYNGYAPYYLSSLNSEEKPMWVGEYGHLYEDYNYEKNKTKIGIRPACWVKIKYER